MGKREKGWRSTQDTPEEIQMCLNCKRSQCVDCISSMRRRAKEERAAKKGWKRKYVHKTVFYRVDGHRVNDKALALIRCYPTCKTDREISAVINVTPGSVCKIRERLGLPRADITPAEEKTRLAQYFLDAIENMEAC